MPKMREIALAAAGLFCGIAPAIHAQTPAGPAWTRLSRGAETIEIHRDRWGIPHAYASTFEGVWFAQGYVTAEDRLWQMERFRRDAGGRFAEVGLWRIEPELTREEAIDHDRWMRRTVSAPRELRRMLTWLDPEVIAVLEAYAEGVNAYITRARAEASLPPAYAQLGFEPEPWDVTDSLAIGELLALRTSDTGSWKLYARIAFDALHAQHGREFAREIFNDLYPLNDANGALTVPAQAQAGLGVLRGAQGLGTNGMAPGRVDAGMLRETAGAWRADRQRALRLGLIAAGRGNAWVVSPRRAAGASPILYAGPMFGAATPSILHEVHLNGPASDDADDPGRLNVFGVAIPGLPAVMSGMNEWGAWACLPRGGGGANYFIESVDAVDPARYFFLGARYALIQREEEIAIWNGGGDPLIEVETVVRSVHGPMLAMSGDRRQGLAISRPWWQVWTYTPVHPWLELNRMDEASDFDRATRLSWTNQHFFYADREGGYGYQWAGRFPAYQISHNLRLPFSGRGGREWPGYIPFERHPRVMVSRGRRVRGLRRPEFLAWWDNKPGERWPGPEGPISPGRFLMAELEQAGAMTLESAVAMAYDAERHDPLAYALKPLVRRGAWRPEIQEDDLVRRAAEAMLEAEAVRGVGNAAQTLYEAFAERLLREAFEREMRFAFDPLDADRYRAPMLNLALRLFDPEASRRPEPGRYLGGRSPDEVIASALKGAVEDLRRERGPNPGDWGHRTGEPWLGALPGGDDPNLQMRGSWMFAAEPGADARALTVLEPGQSGRPDSPHANDQGALPDGRTAKPITLDRPPGGPGAPPRR